jgi:signal transduction histidine kinase
MSKKRRITDRTRLLLTLELAIILPAASLMAFSIANLHHIQRDKAIEAAIQRDFTHVLGIAEKRSWRKATDMLVPLRKEFPCTGESASIKRKLGSILAAHPEFLYAVLFQEVWVDVGKERFLKDHFLIWRSQPARDRDEEFQKRAAEMVNMSAKWLPAEAPDLVQKLGAMAKKEEMPFGFYGSWITQNDQPYYSSIAYFVPPKVSEDSPETSCSGGTGSELVTLGIVGFDPDYLRDTFFPAVMSSVLASTSSALRSDANPPVMMAHAPRSSTPWVSSANWDGGKPEVEKTFTDVFPDIVFSIKYPGTTIDEISARLLRYNYLVLTALSIILAGGIFLTYRNISREMNLARLKSDFVANVSHELRTPLALIRLYAETLELGRLTAPEKYQEYFRIIREESERLTALINNILDFSRIEAGRKEYDFKETDLAELVRSTLDSYRFQIEQNGFAFEENIASNIPPISVDREAIARSLLNLVNNALKYSKDQKFIGVSLYRANGSVKLEVRDRGIGIPPNEQDRIFEKFYRCGDPLVHNVKGSGLGLSLVRHIARAHGGDVSVESVPQKGSKFTIALPIDTTARAGAVPAGAH